MKNQKSNIIIRKVKKGGHGGHHGGSWKVAYADFVTAMMAFFLLLWLITMTSPEKRARVSSYFKDFSLFTTGGTSIMDKSSEMFSEAGPTDQKAFTELPSDDTDNSLSPQSLEETMQKGIISKLGDLADQVLIDIVSEGVRIQMTDKEGSLMFERGSNMMTGKARDILRIIGANIKSLPNKVFIEGHTDALPYSGNGYSNWELSTERASSARKELEANGLNPSRIIRVAGYADTDPLIKENPMDPRNRRISIILKIPVSPSSSDRKSVNNQAGRQINPLLHGMDNVQITLPASNGGGAPVTNRKIEQMVRKHDWSEITKNPPPQQAENYDRMDEGPQPEIIIKELSTPPIVHEDLTPTPGR